MSTDPIIYLTPALTGEGLLPGGRGGGGHYCDDGRRPAPGGSVQSLTGEARTRGRTGVADHSREVERKRTHKSKMRLPTDVAVGLSAVASNVLTGRPERINQRTPRIISGGLLQLELDKPANRQLQAAPAGTDGADAKCDGAFLKCILSETCRGCFATMQENDVDWANVVPDTPCQDVLGKFCRLRLRSL